MTHTGPDDSWGEAGASKEPAKLPGRLSDVEIRQFLARDEVIFGRLREYLDTVEQCLNSEENRAWQYSNESLRGTFWWKGKELSFGYVWPLARGYSFITVVHLMIEGELRQLCSMVRGADQQMRSVSLGSGIREYMMLLEASRCFAVKRSTLPSWQTVCDLELVRNCITHAFGRPEHVRPTDRRRLQRLIQIDKGLRLVRDGSQSGQLMPSMEYCRNTVNVALAFFRELCTAMLTSSSPA
jgi:hypothetical protein